MANNTKQADKLIQVSLSGDVSHIEELLLSKKVDVNCKNAYDQFPLLVASQNGHKEAVKLLIERGAKLNMESLKKVTALSLASECGHHETVQILLENGAHIDHGVSDGRTPLMLASHNGHEETVRVLLSKNANVNARTFGKETALSYALKSKHGEVAKLLLPHVVDVDSKDSNRWTPLMLASLLGSADVTELLLIRGARVNLRTPKRSTALLLASSAGHVETVSVLLKYGADIDLQNDNCYSALLIASERGHKDVVKVLLSNNAEVELYILSSGKTALILASENGYTQIVKLLLYDDNHQNITQTYASQAGSSESQQRLEVSDGQDEKHRSRSAKINVVDTQGKTALTIASSRGDLEMVETLIQHGADVNRIEGENSALSRAVASRNVEIVRLLLKNNATVLLDDLIQASKLGCLEILKLLIPHCPNTVPDLPGFRDLVFAGIIKPSNTFSTPLWWAVRNDHTHIVHLLLENGADVEVSGKEIPTLVIATIQENVEIVEALLKKGTDVDVTCRSFQHESVTPLMLAIVAGHKELVRLFVKHGADICLEHDTGTVYAHFTCMDLAKAVGNQKIISILKEEGYRSQCVPTIAAAGTDPDFEFFFHSHEKPQSYPGLLQLVKSEYQALYQNLNDVHYKSQMEKEPLKDLFPSKENDATNSDQEREDSNKPQLPEPQTPPTVNAAYRSLLPEAASWKNIGTLLDIDFGKLKSIEADKSKSQDALLEMLDEWLKKAEPRPPTWDDLVEAVKPFNESVAQQIREKHCRTM